MKYKILVAEDERLAREELNFQIQQEKDFVSCPSAENGKQLIELYKHYQPDILFIDVEMPILSGIEAVQQLKQSMSKEHLDHPLFVFITAYEEYALQAFDVEAVDYLLKPYGRDRLKETFARLRKRLNHPDHPTQLSKLLIEDGEKVMVIPPQHILYAVRNERYIDIYTFDEHLRTKMTLHELEQKVSGHPFFRPHRSYLVNLDHIQEITPWFNGAYNLIIKNKKEIKIPVSRSAAKALFEHFQN